jgi:hypothetical protein
MLTGYADFLRCVCVTYLLQVDVRVEVVQGGVEEEVQVEVEEFILARGSACFRRCNAKEDCF